MQGRFGKLLQGSELSSCTTCLVADREVLSSIIIFYATCVRHFNIYLRNDKLKISRLGSRKYGSNSGSYFHGIKTCGSGKKNLHKYILILLKKSKKIYIYNFFPILNILSVLYSRSRNCERAVFWLPNPCKKLSRVVCHT